MAPKKSKTNKKIKKEKSPEEISEEEKLKELGIFVDGEEEFEEENEDDESWRDYG